MQNLEEAPFGIHYLDYIKTVDMDHADLAPYRYITVFKRTGTDAYKHAPRDAFRNDSDEIDRYIRERGFNYASLILEDHFIILTEQPLEFNPLMVKLTTGLDLRGEWEYDFNEWIRFEGAEGIFPHLLRE